MPTPRARGLLSQWGCECFIHVHNAYIMYVCVYMYICIERERDTERERCREREIQIYIYIYMFICIERERETLRGDSHRGKKVAGVTSEPGV